MDNLYGISLYKEFGDSGCIDLQKSQRSEENRTPLLHFRVSQSLVLQIMLKLSILFFSILFHSVRNTRSVKPLKHHCSQPVNDQLFIRTKICRLQHFHTKRLLGSSATLLLIK